MLGPYRHAPGVLTRWAAPAVALFLLASCSAEPESGQVEVDLAATVCVEGGQRCFALPVPEAEITVARSEGGPTLAHGTTNEAGRLTLTINATGEVYVTASSPLLAGGKLKHGGIVSDGGVLSVTFRKSMSTEVMIPGE